MKTKVVVGARIRMEHEVAHGGRTSSKKKSIKAAVYNAELTHVSIAEENSEEG